VLISNFTLPRRFGRILLVCSRRCAEVEARLAKIGCRLKKVRDGNQALDTVRHHSFDTAILLSTGEQMDLVETILNLRDIRPSMPVIVLIDPLSSEPSANVQAILARAIPEIPIFTLSQLRTRMDQQKEEDSGKTARCRSFEKNDGQPRQPPGGES
jgi:PleD family two-component response regulator